MTTIVMTMGEGTTAQIEQQLANYAISHKHPYVHFAAKYQEVTILIYTSGKVVFQGMKAEAIAAMFGYDATTTCPDTATELDQPIIGTDEVGNGSYFGGIAVVASFVKPSDHAFLKTLGVGDSKGIKDNDIRRIAPLLQERIPHQSLLLSPEKYNTLVGTDKAYNAVSVKVALHNQAIFLLLQKGVQPQKIIIDAFTSSLNYHKYLKKEKNHFTNPVSLIEKAEGKYLAVAVSSIIARYLFLNNLETLSEKIGYQLPSGAGKASDKIASQILASHGMTGLEHTAKCHFANTQKAINLFKQGGLK